MNKLSTWSRTLFTFHPVIAGFSLLCCLLYLVVKFQPDIFGFYATGALRISLPFLLSALLTAIIVSNNNSSSKKKAAWLYTLLSLLFVFNIIRLLPSLSLEHYVSFILVLLTLFVFCRPKSLSSDTGTAHAFFHSLFAFAFAAALSLLALAVVALINETTIELFGLNRGNWSEFLYVFTLMILAPQFVLRCDQILSENSAEGATPLLNILINWIFSPALLLYFGVLSIYFVSSLISEQTPKGTVVISTFAYFILGFTLVLSQHLSYTPSPLTQQLQRWYPFTAIPTVILFWWAIVIRTGEYGWTIQRIYTFAFGLVIVATTLSLFVSRHHAVRTFFISFVVALIAASAIDRPLTEASQYGQLKALAEELHLIDAEGKYIPLKDVEPAIAKGDPRLCRIDDIHNYFEENFFLGATIALGPKTWEWNDLVSENNTAQSFSAKRGFQIDPNRFSEIYVPDEESPTENGVIIFAGKRLPFPPAQELYQAAKMADAFNKKEYFEFPLGEYLLVFDELGFSAPNDKGEVELTYVSICLVGKLK